VRDEKGEQHAQLIALVQQLEAQAAQEEDEVMEEVEAVPSENERTMRVRIAQLEHPVLT
jgi:hypothetical protein